MVSLGQEMEEELSQEFRHLEEALKDSDEANVKLTGQQERLGHVKNRSDKMIDQLARKVDNLSDQWTDLVMKQQNELNEQFNFATESLPDENRKMLTPSEVKDLKARVPLLQQKVSSLVQLDKEAKGVHRRADEDSRRLGVAVGKARDLERRQERLLKLITPTEKMTETQAKETILKAAGLLEKRGGAELASDLKKFLSLVEKTPAVTPAASSWSQNSLSNGEIPAASVPTAAVAVDSLTTSDTTSDMNKTQSGAFTSESGSSN